MLRRAGEAFASIRKARGYSQADLARAVRLHVNTVSNIERGAFEPSILALGLICLELGCDRIVFDAAGFEPVPGPSAGAGRLSAGRCPSESDLALLHGASVRERRMAAGHTLGALARAASLHPNTLYALERGLAAPCVLGVYRIYRLLDLPYVDGAGGPRS